MSLAQFAACVEGYNRAQGGEEQGPPPMTAERYDEILEQRGYR